MLQICTQSHRADECNEMSIFLEIHMCENDPRLPNSTCIENLKRPQFPQRKPHSVHFSKIEYAILILTLIHENFSAALEFLPLVYSVSRYFVSNFQLTCFFLFQMVQAIQVLRFHLLELEKVSHYFCQLKTF